MRGITAAIVALASTGLVQGAVAADGCSRSREDLLGGSGRALPNPPQTYQSLFQVCRETAGMINVKDAFILEDGGIGVIPRREGVAATSVTLAEFCRRFPRATLHFLTGRAMRNVTSIRAITGISSGGSTSCQTIVGKMS